MTLLSHWRVCLQYHTKTQNRIIFLGGWGGGHQSDDNLSCVRSFHPTLEVVYSHKPFSFGVRKTRSDTDFNTAMAKSTTWTLTHKPWQVKTDLDYSRWNDFVFRLGLLKLSEGDASGPSYMQHFLRRCNLFPWFSRLFSSRNLCFVNLFPLWECHRFDSWNTNNNTKKRVIHSYS